MRLPWSWGPYPFSHHRSAWHGWHGPSGAACRAALRCKDWNCRRHKGLYALFGMCALQMAGLTNFVGSKKASCLVFGHPQQGLHQRVASQSTTVSTLTQPSLASASTTGLQPVCQNACILTSSNDVGCGSGIRMQLRLLSHTAAEPPTAQRASRRSHCILLVTAAAEPHLRYDHTMKSTASHAGSCWQPPGHSVSQEDQGWHQWVRAHWPQLPAVP